MRRHAVAMALACSLCACQTVPPRTDPDAEARVAHDPQALTRIGSAAAASDDNATAAAFYGRAVQLDPSDAGAACAYARSLVQQGEVDEAVVALRAALAHVAAQDRTRIATPLGRLLVMQQRPSEAVSVFRAALDQAPRDVALLIGLGVSLDSSRDFPAAAQAYRRALAIDPDNVAARNDLALSMALDGPAETALANLLLLRAQVAETGGTASALATIDGNLALLYAMRGDLHDAARAGAGATSDAAALVSNMRFYSALDPEAADSGAADSSGLPLAGRD